jgi:hypothetical protein
MSCAQTETFKKGDGSTTLFTFSFTYRAPSEVNVALLDPSTDLFVPIGTDQWSLNNANTVEFVTAPPNSTVNNIRIYRDTNVDNIYATFQQGSAIRTEDLNQNFLQLLDKAQELDCDKISTSDGIDSLPDVDINNPTTGQIIEYDGTDWVNVDWHQANWNEQNSSDPSFIQNKPDIDFVSDINAGTGIELTGTDTSPIINIANTGVSAGSYTAADVTVNAQGQITNISNSAPTGVTSIIAGENIVIDQSTGDVTISAKNTGGGTIGWWTRTGSELSPANPNDNVLLNSPDISDNQGSGVQLFSSVPNVLVQRPSGSSSSAILFSGYNGNTRTFSVGADGSINAANDIKAGERDPSSSNARGVRIAVDSGNGGVYAQSKTPSSSLMAFQALAGTTEKFKVTYDGAVDADGKITGAGTIQSGEGFDLSSDSGSGSRLTSSAGITSQRASTVGSTGVLFEGYSGNTSVFKVGATGNIESEGTLTTQDEAAFVKDSIVSARVGTLQGTADHGIRFQKKTSSNNNYFADIFLSDDGVEIGDGTAGSNIRTNSVIIQNGDIQAKNINAGADNVSPSINIDSTYGILTVKNDTQLPITDPNQGRAQAIRVYSGGNTQADITTQIRTDGSIYTGSVNTLSAITADSSDSNNSNQRGRIGLNPKASTNCIYLIDDSQNPAPTTFKVSRGGTITALGNVVSGDTPSSAATDNTGAMLNSGGNCFVQRAASTTSPSSKYIYSGYYGDTATFRVSLDGTVNSNNAVFNLDPDDPNNYTTVTNDEGETTSVYTGRTLDVKQSIRNVQSALYRLKAAVLLPDATVDQLRLRILEALENITEDMQDD